MCQITKKNIILFFTAYSNTLDFGPDRKKRSLSKVIDNYNSGIRNFFSPQKQQRKKTFRGIYPKPPSNETSDAFWKPVKNHQPFYNEVKPQFKAGNQTYKLVYNNKLPPKETVKRKNVYPVYQG